MFLEDIEEADIEDLFTKEEYLAIFNETFNEYEDINIGDLNSAISRIILQISQHIGVKRFNHYRPAKLLLQKALSLSDFNSTTLDTFEAMFKKINTLFL